MNIIDFKAYVPRNIELKEDSMHANRPTLPEMSDEILLYILTRLSMRSLLWFKSICKA